MKETRTHKNETEMSREGSENLTSSRLRSQGDMNMESIFSSTGVIYQYTRADAIRDGVLVDLSANFPDISAQLYKFPVACTAAVWSIIEAAVANKKFCNDLCGVIWDVLWMSQRGIIKRIDESQHIFQVIITGASQKSHYDFKVICHPGDEAEPVLTIMLPDED